MPDLDSLVLFVQAAEMGNLTRAAEAVHITAPAASRRLSLLEHQFKTPLFERHSRGLQLTPAGAQLLTLAREVIAGVHHMRAEMANYASGQHSVLRVHGNTSAMAQFLPADVARFQASHQQVRITLEECWSDEAVRRVRSGEADLGVVVEGCDLQGLHSRPYRQDQRIVLRMCVGVGDEDVEDHLVEQRQGLSRTDMPPGAQEAGEVEPGPRAAFVFLDLLKG